MLNIFKILQKTKIPIQCNAKLPFIEDKYSYGLHRCYFQHSLKNIFSSKFLAPSYTCNVNASRKLYHDSNANNIPRPKYAVAQAAVQISPRSLQPYLELMRFDRPIGSWLLFWPCAWSLALAAPATTILDFHLLCLFAMGSLIMRGAGCTVNDMWDKNIDKKVLRTVNRPLASDRLNLVDAFSFLGLQLGVGCLILLQLNWYSITLGVSSLGFVFLYPLMKRITYWPQLMLGFTFNWGALIGWSALRGCCDWSVCLPLYLAGISWTLIYDTIYAHQDKSDDVILGMKSTAILFGESTRLCLTSFAALMASGLTVAGLGAGQSWPYFAGVSAVSLHLARQIFTLDINNAEDCGKKFRSNRFVGWILFAGILGGNVIKNIDYEARDKHNETSEESCTLER